MMASGILLIDDDEQILFEIGQTLRKAGFPVSTLNSGRGAIDAVARGDFGLVIVDFTTRGLNGLEGVGKIRRAASGVSVMVFSRESDPISVIIAFRLGAMDYLIKPATPEQVLSSVSCWQRRYRSEAAGQQSEKMELLLKLKDSFDPLLRRLKNSRLDPDQKNCVEFMELNLNQVISPYVVA